MSVQTRPWFTFSSARDFFWGGGGGAGMESEPMLTPRKNPLYRKKFPSEDRTHDAASSWTASPTRYQRAIPTPCCIKHYSEPNTLPTSCSGPSGGSNPLSTAEEADALFVAVTSFFGTIDVTLTDPPSSDHSALWSVLP